MKTITNIEIENIHNFINIEVERFKRAMPPQRWNEIIVSLPNWLKHVLERNTILVNRDIYPTSCYPPFFYGTKTQPHYANEIVVFYEDYHLSSERFEPRIYQIKVIET